MSRPLKKSDSVSFRLSLRYKVALPVLILVTAMLFTLFQGTFRFVRDLVLERNERRLLSISEVFRESLKVPLSLGNQQVLEATLQWMSDRADVLEVQVENELGEVIGSTNPQPMKLPQPLALKSFSGAQRISANRYGTAVKIEMGPRPLGRLVIVFSQMSLEEELKQIFIEKMLLAFVMGSVLALTTAGVVWLALRPLFKLKRTVQEILSGNLEARADIHSFDEIQDLAEAFNEMVSRLSKSLENLRARSQALEDSEEKYRLIVDNASDIIFALSPGGEMVFLNEGFSGCSREEILEGGLELFRQLHEPSTLGRFDEALKTAREKHESVINVATAHVHRGLESEIFYLTNFTPLLDHEGQVKMIQGVMRDVTELRRIELMKESLIRDVAHELKTPTAKFEMAVHWFKRELELNPDIRKYEPVVELLRSNTDRLMRTITSIMDLSKLESGMQEIVPQELDLNLILSQAALDLEPMAAKKGLSLEMKLSKSPLKIQGDRDMLYRVFVNLINNAIKYTPKGGMTVSSYTQGGHVMAEVRDTGIGIEELDLKSIFDRFVQKTSASEGIGVGLTICRDIAVLHRAKIWAESEGLGKGSVFKVRF
ncbi:MAG: cell wall metabolism sensor histidine kinase WalK [Candidatus Omnitrophica bacterium]|nr:cell wall metabolism sensor histidine kinase WalK [Candidatus Omnitrophota bacterium]